MARAIRKTSLENRTPRLKLPIERKPVFVRIAPGLSLGYRRNQVAGTWVMRIADGKGSASTKAIGTADDFEEADGDVLLNYWQAQDKAKSLHRGANGRPVAKPLTVRMAAEVYLASQDAKNPRTARDARCRLKKHFLPKFGDRLVVDLTKAMLEGWLNSMASTVADREKVRKSKDSANRVLTMVKALLNHAIQDPANHLTDDHAWRLVKPFGGVAVPRAEHFIMEEARKLIKACREKDFANLLTAGIMTGARYGELANCSVADFDAASQTLRVVFGKTKSRTVILQKEAAAFLSELSEKRPKDEPLLARSDGGHWGPSQQQRRMKQAIESAGLDPKATFYALRHSYISRAIEGEVPLIIIAENCGTSVRMIEKTYAKTLASKRREFIERGVPTLGVVGSPDSARPN